MATPHAVFKDLCIDADDPRLIGTFWAALLGLELGMQAGGDAFLSGPTPQHRIWINGVPEPVTVKQRLHLDVNVASVDQPVAAGATIVDDASFPWTVLRDPEGGELCAFVRETPRAHAIHALVLDSDAADGPGALARWWAEVLGGTVEHHEAGYSSVASIPGAPFDRLDIVPVPEPKRVKNRIHIDVVAADTGALVQLGARVLRAPGGAIGWTVMADPEGNEFCAFDPPDQRAG